MVFHLNNSIFEGAEMNDGWQKEPLEISQIKQRAFESYEETSEIEIFAKPSSQIFLINPHFIAFKQWGSFDISCLDSKIFRLFYEKFRIPPPRPLSRMLAMEMSAK
jgi:hypothetical protein